MLVLPCLVTVDHNLDKCKNTKCRIAKVANTEKLNTCQSLLLFPPPSRDPRTPATSMIMILTLTTDQIRYHLVDLSPDKKDDGEKVEDDQGRDEDRRLRSIVPRPLPSPSLKKGYLIVAVNGVHPTPHPSLKRA